MNFILTTLPSPWYCWTCVIFFLKSIYMYCVSESSVYQIKALPKLREAAITLETGCDDAAARALLPATFPARLLLPALQLLTVGYGHRRAPPRTLLAVSLAAWLTAATTHAWTQTNIINLVNNIKNPYVLSRETTLGMAWFTDIFNFTFIIT